MAGKPAGGNRGDNDAAERSCGGSDYRHVAARQLHRRRARPAHDIESLTIAEPFGDGGADKIVFILKVASLSTNLQNARWRVSFKLPGDGHFGSYVELRGTQFQYSVNNTSGGKAAESNFNPDGTITMVLSKSKLKNISAGQKLTALSASVFTDADVLVENDRARREGFSLEYELTGNCAASAVLPGASRLLNISTRARVQTGEKEVITGYILGGPQSRRLVVRGLRAIAGGARRKQCAGGSHLPMIAKQRSSEHSNPVRTRPSSAATTRAAASGWSRSTISVRPVHRGSPTSARGNVETGEDVMIGGFIIGPNDTGNANVVLRALGPSLQNAGVRDALQDPVLELRDASGTLVASSDNWKENQAAIEAAGIPPSDERESALVQTLPSGNYTAIIRGKNNTTGVGLVEVYNVR